MSDQNKLSALSTPADVEPTGYLFEMRYESDRWSGTMFAESINIPPEDVRNIRPLYSAPVADIEPVSVPDGERRQGFYWIKASDGWEPWKWTPKGWTNDFVASYYTDEEIGEIGPYIPFPLAAAPHPTKTEAVDADAVEKDHARGCEGRNYTCTCGYDDSRDAVIERLREALTRMENCCEYLAATRSHEIYTAMIDGGQAQALLDLDTARSNARAALKSGRSQP